MSTHPTRRQEFMSGFRDTLPLIAGAIPFGIAFGAVSVTVGLSPAATLGMSLFVFAGSAQFIAAGLVAQETGIALIILTTFIVNLRHALYSASLGRFMNHLPQRWLLPLGFWLTDETYAVTIRHYQRSPDAPHRHWFMLGSALPMYLNWQLCTLIGIITGQSIQGAQEMGLDFAMIATFIGIVVPLIANRPMLVCAVVSGATAVLASGMPHKLGLIAAAGAGIAAGFITETYLRRSTAAHAVKDTLIDRSPKEPVP
jgi:4-azaleucine resistance transporter AzlC